MDWKQIPPLAALRAFDAAARARNFSRAARTLNVTPAAVIQQVRQLERDLGLALTKREGRGIALTRDGARLAQSLDSAFQEIAASVADLRVRQRSGEIRVSTTPNIVSEFLIGRLNTFWQDHPDTEVALIPSQNYTDLVFDEYDLAIRGGDGDFPGYEVDHLLETRWVAVMTPEHVGALSSVRWVRNPEFQLQADLMRAAGVDPEAVDSAGLVTPGHSLDAVREGLGATIANAFIVRKDVAAGRLVAVELAADMPRVAYWAVRPRRPVRDATDAFMGWLTETFQAELQRYPGAGSAPVT